VTFVIHILILTFPFVEAFELIHYLGSLGAA